MAKVTKTEKVLNHLERNGSITSWVAIQQYGVTRLSAIIFNLRKKGYDIESVPYEFIDRYGDKAMYVEYVLK